MADYDKPLPVIDALNRPYWDHARAHRLAVQRCSDCGQRRFPPSPVCPACLSAAQVWEVVSGRATLLTWARFHRAYWPGFRDALPYDVCVVRLEEGPLMLANFGTPPPAAPHLGMALRVVFDDVTPEVSLARFVAD